MKTATKWTVGVLVVLIVSAIGAAAYASTQSDGPGGWGPPGPWRGGWANHEGMRGGPPFGPPSAEQVRETRSELAADIAAELDASASASDVIRRNTPRIARKTHLSKRKVRRPAGPIARPQWG